MSKITHSRSFLVFGDDWINNDYVRDVSQERAHRSRFEYRYRVVVEIGDRWEERIIFSDYDAPQTVAVHDMSLPLRAVQEKSAHATGKRNRLGF